MKNNRTVIKISRKPLLLPLAVSIAALLSAHAQATTFNWFNTGTDWGTGGNWLPSGPPTSADIASFNPQFGSGTSVLNPDIEGSQAAIALNINNNFLGGTYTFTGAGTLTLGGAVTVRGSGTEVINGPTLAGAAAGNLTFNVGSDSGLTLQGATTATTNAGAVTLGGTLTLDNTANNSLKLGSGSNVSLVGGTLSIQGNALGTAYSLGTLSNNAGYNTVSLTSNGGTGTTVNFANAAGSLRTQTFMAINFNAGSGTLGSLNGPQVTFTGAQTTSTGAVGGNGNMLANSTTGLTVGFATVTDSNGTNWATYITPSGGTGGIVAITPSTTVTDAPGLAGLTTTNVAQFNPAAGTAVTATTTAIAASVRITPGGANSTLDLATNSVGLNTNALMITGSNDFTISGVSTSLMGTVSSGTKYVYVTNATTTLTTGLVFGGSNPTNFAGPGFVALNGAYPQNTLTSNNRLNLLGGVLRGNNTQIGFGATGGAGMISIRGGVLEIQNGGNGLGSSADFLRPLATTATAGAVNWTTSATDEGSGGFSAFGAPASVNLGGSATPSQVTWGSGGFVADGYALTFGSIKSNATLSFLNPIGLDAGTVGTYAAREIKVTQGAGSAVDKTTLAGVITGSSTSDLLKTATGVLELNQPNTYAGNTLVQGGTLLATNTTGTATGTGSTLVENGAKLAGNGILGPVTLQLGGKLAPGALLDTTPTTLSASGLIWNAGATLVFDLSTANNTSDQLALSGALTRGVSGVFAFDFDAGGKAGQIYNLITFNSTTFASNNFTATDLAPGVGGAFQFSGNTLQFAATAVPEPSAVLSIVCGITTLGVFGRFRRRFC